MAVRVMHWSWRHAVVLSGVVLVLVVGLAFLRIQRIANEAKSTTIALEHEVTERTAESCTNAVQARNDLRNAFLGIIAQFPPSASSTAISEYVEKQFPPLSCPDGSPIIIPIPVTTVP